MTSVTGSIKPPFFRPFADAETMEQEEGGSQGQHLDASCSSALYLAGADMPKGTGDPSSKREAEDRNYPDLTENPLQSHFIHQPREEEGKETASQEQKPAMSYIALIAKAILAAPNNKLNLGSIYKYIEETFPYYRGRGQGWRNSVRHNLSLNECFIKAGRCEDGKGNYWSIHPSNLEDFSKGDFRQRRRCRRRGRSKELENKLPVPYPSCPLPVEPLALHSLYSPYTEQERRAYRLDEVLYRQYITNPFWRWYHSCRTPGAACDAGVGLSSGQSSGPQWQGLGERASSPNFFKSANN
ncbi:forkhead box protein D4-like 3 [Scyliorhinus canicula]|uniref:forkhead box protein D4-like 3 n=1 Tax=Scyliorhinus canicula TaxID=7830 RepID=UPI0018F72CBF|nr:forkhead box protein D4-like 3 [Scyliorhinus canicula]